MLLLPLFTRQMPAIVFLQHENPKTKKKLASNLVINQYIFVCQIFGLRLQKQTEIYCIVYMFFIINQPLIVCYRIVLFLSRS